MRLALPFGPVDPFEMGIGDVKIGDVLHCLPEQCRFNGYTKQHYSVAQHSVLVSRLAAVDHEDYLPLLRAALIHDMVEAYTGDVVMPLKRRMPEFEHLEAQVDRVVWEAFGLPWGDLFIRDKVRFYDRLACKLECQNLLFYVPEGMVGPIEERYREAAADLLTFIPPSRARHLMMRELRSLGFGDTWCPAGPIQEGWRQMGPLWLTRGPS